MYLLFLSVWIFVVHAAFCMLLYSLPPYSVCVELEKGFHTVVLCLCRLFSVRIFVIHAALDFFFLIWLYNVCVCVCVCVCVYTVCHFCCCKLNPCFLYVDLSSSLIIVASISLYSTSCWNGSECTWNSWWQLVSIDQDRTYLNCFHVLLGICVLIQHLWLSVVFFVCL